MTRDEHDGGRGARPGVPHWTDPIDAEGAPSAGRPPRASTPHRTSPRERSTNPGPAEAERKRISPEDEAVSIWKGFGRFLMDLLGG